MFTNFKSRFCKLFFVSGVGIISLSACISGSISRPTNSANSIASNIPHPTNILTPPSTSLGSSTSAEGLGELSLYKAPTLISSLENASEEDVISTLFRKWLEYLKTDLVSEYIRLTDYKVENVSVMGYCPPPDNNTKVFVTQIQFSVQTLTLHPGDWVAFPNATLGDDHWLYHLSPYVAVSAANGIYTLDLEPLPCNK